MIEALTAGVSKGYVPAIRASKEWHKRPTSIIMRDDWFGHRNPFTGVETGDREEWTSWDHLLADAVQVISDYSDSNGILRWIHDDEAVEINANKKIDKFEAAKAIATSGSKYKAAPGEYFVPDVFTRRTVDGVEVYQTYRQWIEAEAAKNAEKG